MNLFIFNKKNHLFSIVLAFILILVFLYSLTSFSISPTVGSDSGYGFLVLKSMNAGYSFNCMVVPNPNDISKDSEVFLSWWSPGQYIIPGLINKYLNNLGLSISITVIIFSAAGLWGLYKLYRLLQFDALISIFSILIVSLQRYYSVNFNNYWGGEVLIFGGMPWIIFFSLKYREMKVLHSILFLILCLVGFILKSSFMVCLLAILLTLMLLKIQKTASDNNRSFKNLKFLLVSENITYALTLLVMLSLVYFTTSFLFLSRGNTPPLSGSATPNVLMNIFFTISSPFCGAFSIDQILTRLFKFPGSNYPFLTIFSIFYVLFSIPCIYLLIQIFRKSNFDNVYKTILLSFNLVYFSFFIVIYSRGTPISFEYRHMLILGLLFLPGILTYVYRISKSNAVKMVFTVFIVSTCFYSVAGLINRDLYVLKNYPLGHEGFRHTIIDKETLNVLHHLDDSYKEGNNIFYVTSPEIALELKQNRYIASQADFEPIDSLSSQAYFGVVDNLILVIQKKFKDNGKEQAITNSFKGYKDFELLAETKNFIILSGNKKMTIPD